VDKGCCYWRRSMCKEGEERNSYNRVMCCTRGVCGWSTAKRNSLLLIGGVEVWRRCGGVEKTVDGEVNC